MLFVHDTPPESRLIPGFLHPVGCQFLRASVHPVAGAGPQMHNLLQKRKMHRVSCRITSIWRGPVQCRWPLLRFFSVFNTREERNISSNAWRNLSVPTANVPGPATKTASGSNKGRTVAISPCLSHHAIGIFGRVLVGHKRITAIVLCKIVLYKTILVDFFLHGRLRSAYAISAEPSARREGNRAYPEERTL